MIKILRRLIRENITQDTSNRKVVTFDFDDTLLWTRVIRDEDGDYLEHVPAGKNTDIYPIFIDMLNNPDVEAHIVTSRHGKSTDPNTPVPSSYTEVFDQLKDWGVIDKVAGIHFTNGNLKIGKLRELGSELHFDDDTEELVALRGTGIKGVQAYPHPSWERSQ